LEGKGKARSKESAKGRGAAMVDEIQNLLPADARLDEPSLWQPVHLDDPPEPPPIDTREADLAALAAQEKLGHDGKRQRVRARRTVDPFGGLERWKIVRIRFLSGFRGEPLSTGGGPSFELQKHPYTIPSSCAPIRTISSMCVSLLQRVAASQTHSRGRNGSFFHHRPTGIQLHPSVLATLTLPQTRSDVLSTSSKFVPLFPS
jgi:hypothetical protein